MKNDKSIILRWWDFHRANRKVYELFEKEVFKAISKNKKKLSSKTIIEFIRWNIYIETEGDDTFKINNNYTAHYARHFENRNPAFKGLFEMRKLRS